MARGPFLIPSILWHRAWGTLPQVGAVEEGVAAQADRLILGLNLAGYEVTQILLGVGADASMDGFGLELESRRSIEFTSWAAETGEAWPPNALAALGLRVVPRTLLEDMVAVFALDLTTTGLVAGVTFDAEQEGWLTIVVPALDELIESALEAFPVAEEPVLQALAQDLANEWDASTPEPPAQPNPVSAGLLWIYDPTHWRYTSRAGATPWEALVDAAAWAWTQADTLSAKQSWLEAVLLGQEPTLLDRLETYSLEAGGEAGSVVAEQLTQVASLQYVALAGPLSDGDSVLFEDLLLLPYTVGLLLLQDLFLINFLGAVDTFVANNEWTEPDLTGFYERDDGGGYDTLQLNQAGRFLEGDWQERITVVDQEFRVRSFVGYSFSASSLAASPLQFQFARSTDVVVGWHLNETQPGTFELEAIRVLLEAGQVVIAAGGGGIPVVNNDGRLVGVEAVIDKDWTAALVADQLDAETLVIVTCVPCAYLFYNTQQQQAISQVTPAQLKVWLDEGHFAPGSMRPKAEAAIQFASKPGRRAIICDVESLPAALAGDASTIIEGVPTSQAV